MRVQARAFRVLVYAKDIVIHRIEFVKGRARFQFESNVIVNCAQPDTGGLVDAVSGQ